MYFDLNRPAERSNIYHSMPDFIIPALLLIDGLICIVLALFAHEIGLDPTTTWGRGRLFLLVLGAILACVFPLWANLKNRKDSLGGIFRAEAIKTGALLGHLWGVIFVIYIWFITFGHFTTWTHTTHYYTQLADAFSKGQLYVDVEPDKALLEASNPYDHTSRPPFKDEVWDLSLYKEKLYLYWGPVPALLLTPIQVILGRKITDNYLVFFSYAALLIVNSLIIIRLRKNIFPQVAAWNMFVCVALIGLILPISWSLNTPNVYEAALAAGQFFLLGGIYFVLSAVERDTLHHGRYLFLAGLFWACAVGSRAINALSVIFFAAAISIWIAKELPRPFQWRIYLRTMSALYVPLMCGAVMMGWYNWARFDSPLEFGLRYQITVFNLNEGRDLTFRPDYIFLNLYAYLFQPFEFIPRFPFLQPLETSNVLNKLGIVPPHIYTPGRITGILFGAPFLILSLPYLFLQNRTSHKKPPFSVVQSNAVMDVLLGGSFLISFLAVLFYFFGQMRFLVDSISQVTLLAIMGYWKILSLRQRTSSPQSKRLALLANFLLVFTFCTSLLLPLTGEMDRMETLNPSLFETINNVLSIPDLR